MKKTIMGSLALLLFFVLVSCGVNYEYRFKVEGHDLSNYTEVEVKNLDILEIFLKIDFNNDKKRVLYSNESRIYQEYKGEKLVLDGVLRRKQLFVYNINESGQWIADYSGKAFSENKRNKEKYGYNAKVFHDGENYAYDFSKLTPREASSIDEKGKYQTKGSTNITIDGGAEFSHVIQLLHTLITSSSFFESQGLKKYADENGNFLLRKDDENSIWSLLCDSSFNVISFYKKHEITDEYEDDMDADSKTITSNKYECYIVYDTDLDFEFDFSDFKKVDNIYI